MAVIGKIRKRSGLLVVIIGVALAAFVLGDFLNPGSRRRTSNDIGIIAGENITYDEFNTRAEEQLEQMRQRMNTDRLSADEIFQTRQMTWNQMVNDIIMGVEFEKLGLALSSDELFDQVQGPNPHPFITQNFINPETGQYDRNMVINYLKNLDNMEAEGRNQWLTLEKAIKQDRIATKYKNLLSKAYYVPRQFAEMEYKDRNTMAQVRVATLRYNSIPDDQVSVTDEDFKKYYEENKYRFQQEEGRDIEYVVFEVQPSAEDQARAQKEIQDIYNDFLQATDMQSFVNANSDDRYDSTYKMAGQLSPYLDTTLFNAQVGTIVGPYFDNGNFYVAKLTDVQMRPDSMKASHLLISYQGAANADPAVTRTKDQAKAMADSLANILKLNPGLMEVMARQHSNDGSVNQNGGDLGWFADQTMVGPFNEAVINTQTGQVTEAETAFGYHIILVTGKKDPVRKARIAMVRRAMDPSAKTFQDVYTVASQFAGDNTTAQLFDQAVTQQGLNKRMAPQVKRMDNRLPGVENPRAIIQWSYLETTDKGEVSGVFDMEGNYVVAMLKEKYEKGIAPLEVIKPNIQPLVIRDKKAEMLIEKFKQAGSDLYQIAMATGAQVDTLNNVTFASFNLPMLGPEPEVTGMIFAIPTQQLSEPVKGNNGVYMLLVDARTAPQPKEDYTLDVMPMIRNFEGKINQQYFTVLEKLFEIEDNRHLYF